jgi:hypothetical protein
MTRRDFYVYLHHKADDGTVFYVGKGCGHRAFVRSDRRNHGWQLAKKKHGLNVSFLRKDMPEVCALTLERMAIHFFRERGFPLTNIFDAGGNSATGFKPNWRKPVVCSNGMQFPSADDAAAWCRKIGYSSINGGHITACARGVRGSAYGFSWWFLGNKPATYVARYVRSSINSPKSVLVNCSNGMSFNSQAKAAIWCRAQGYKKACQSGISAACNGKMAYAYGHAWWVDRARPMSLGNAKLKSRLMSVRSKKVIMNDNVCFFSIMDAISSMKDWGLLTSASGIIASCKSGGIKKSGGMAWAYLK